MCLWVGKLGEKKEEDLTLVSLSLAVIESALNQSWGLKGKWQSGIVVSDSISDKATAATVK